MTHSQKVTISIIVTIYQNLKRKYSFKTPFLSPILCTYNNKEIFSIISHCYESCKIYEMFKTKKQSFSCEFLFHFWTAFSVTFSFCLVHFQSKMAIDFKKGMIKECNSLFTIDETNTTLQ